MKPKSSLPTKRVHYAPTPTKTSTWPGKSLPNDLIPSKTTADQTSSLLLRLKETGDQIEVLEATLVESSGVNNNGIFYEKAVDEVIVLDEAKRMLYCVRNDNEKNKVKKILIRTFF